MRFIRTMLLARQRNMLPSPSGRGIEGEGSISGVSNPLTPAGFIPLVALSPEGKKTISLIAGLIVMIALFPLTACGMHGGAIKGRVLDAETNKPIPDVIVVVTWHGTYSIPFADTQSSCYHVETATTDEQGYFMTPEWSEKSKGLMFSEDYWLVDVYKAGYAERPGPHVVQGGKTDISYLLPFKGTREERIEYLEREYYRTKICRNKKLLSYWKAAYDEAAEIAKATGDWTIADSFLSEIEMIQYGYEEGLKRAIERAEGRRHGHEP